MFEGFTRTELDTSGARIHLRHGGDGPPLLLLHGNPMTHVSWHKIAPRLAKDFPRRLRRPQRLRRQRRPR
jgi:haloacetate dehalogenase